MDKVKDNTAAIWYAEESIKNGWSRNVLVHQIESKLYERQAIVSKISNFEKLLPAVEDIQNRIK